ncbi:hypothetical protein AAHE18_02G137900 [Arachis hypogaea]
MTKMGLDAYRFSISWSRLIPGIQAHVTLHHWDLPQALEDEYGGWVNKKIVKDFTAYADVCFREFGDRVKHWTTMNEGNAFAEGGYDIGFLPPQHCSPSSIFNCSKGNSSTEPYLVTHNMLLAHASAATLYRNKYQFKQHGFIGFNLITYGFVPLTNSSEDITAVQRAQDFYHGWFLNPFTFGDYPETMKKNVGSRLPIFTKSESNLVKGSIDFLGINFYFSFYVKDNPRSLYIKERDYAADIAAEFIGQQKHRNSSLEDWPRINYLQEYIGSILHMLRNGHDIRGYFVWSFMDVFELLSGYEFTYGLYYIDLKDPTLRRQPKFSSVWYSNFLNNRTMDPMVAMQIEKNSLLQKSI